MSKTSGDKKNGPSKKKFKTCGTMVMAADPNDENVEWIFVTVFFGRPHALLSPGEHVPGDRIFASYSVITTALSNIIDHCDSHIL